MSWTTSGKLFDVDVASRAIVQCLQERKAVLFCGAGISMDPPATLPDWKSFRDSTITALATTDVRLQKLLPTLLERPLIAQGKQGLAPEVVVSQVHTIVPNFFECLTAFDHDEWNDNHLLIARLAQAGFLDKIVTTNFDCLIEKALASLGVKFHVYRSDSDFSQRGSGASQQAIEIFKLHGCLTDADTIVATVEQEAIGLSKAKAEVLRQLWAGRTVIFWGYSGADLKVQQDYLQLAASAHAIQRVFWNLHSTDAWQEQPLPELHALVTLLGDKGQIQHLQLPDIFRSVIGLDENSNREATESKNIQQLIADRTQELQNSIQQWVQDFVLPRHSLEIFGHLLKRVDQLGEAWICYGWLGEVSVETKGFAGTCLVAIARTHQALLAYSLGDLEGAEFCRRQGRELALNSGSIDLLLQLAMVNAGLLQMQGHTLRSLQPRGFAHRISQWASPTARKATFELRLDTIKMFIEQGLRAEAQSALERIEGELRDAGFLEILCRTKAAHAQLCLEMLKPNEALRNIREAREIAVALGLERWEKLMHWREFYVTQTLNSESNEELLALIDKTIRERDTSLLNEATSLLLDVLDVLQIDTKKVLELLNLAIDAWQDEPRRLDKELNPINSQYIERENSRLTSRIMINKARCYRRLERFVDELSTIEVLLPRVSRAGYELYAAELFERYAELKLISGCPVTELISHFEAGTRHVRESKKHSALLEDNLARLRKDLGRGQYPEDFDLFLGDCFKGCGVEIEGVHEILVEEARSMGQPQSAPELSFVDSLTSYFGEAGKFTWCLSVVARMAESARQVGNAELALKVATNALQVSELLGDNYYVGVFHNQIGLDLNDLNRKAEAKSHFELAVASSDRSGDNVRLVHYLFNAAQMNFDLAKHDTALQLYSRLNKVVAERDDIVAYKRMTWNFGKALKATGYLKEAMDFLEAAEHCAWLVDDRKLVLQIREYLAKVYWDIGEYGPSIAYRVACEQFFAETGQLAEAAAAALLIGNTYDEKLGRAIDAMHYYNQAIAYFEGTTNSLVAVALERLLKCKSKAKKLRPWLYELLVNYAGSEEAAEPLALRLSIFSCSYNLWHFELRSWAAWIESNYPPAVLGFNMIELGRSARELHEFSRAKDMFALAERLAYDLKGEGVEYMDKIEAEARVELESCETVAPTPSKGTTAYS